MHVNRIENENDAALIARHQGMVVAASAIVTAWERTPPMASVDQVRAALTIDGEPDALEDLIPYAVDECRARGLLV